MLPISWANSTAIVGKYMFENSKKKTEKNSFSQFNASLCMQYESLDLLRNDYVMISAKKKHFLFIFFFRIFKHLFFNNSGRIGPWYGYHSKALDLNYWKKESKIWKVDFLKKQFFDSALSRFSEIKHTVFDDIFENFTDRAIFHLKNQLRIFELH